MISLARWTRSERRSLLLGSALCVAGTTGMFGLFSGDSIGADGQRPRDRRKAEIQRTAGEEAAAAEYAAKMEAAMDQASEKLDDFIAALKKPAATQKDFSVKYLVEQGEAGEYLWVNEVKFDGKKFTGKVANHPQVVKTLKFGQQVALQEDEIDDWMYVDDGKLKGGFTIRAQREMLKGADRKKFDEQFKFTFE
ncbi:MAG: DUF2314 domain-containing protein [Planctomyces sp.]|nr:DUF2314 domain-containing protein [Planctomyces sp.]